MAKLTREDVIARVKSGDSLEQEDLSGLDLSGADLYQANLQKAMTSYSGGQQQSQQKWGSGGYQ